MSASEEFKKQVQEYMQIDNDLKKARGVMKTLNKRKETLSLNINGFMRNNNIDELKLQDCKIKTYTSTTTASINQEWILKRLTILMGGNEGQAQEWCDFICDKEARDKKQKNTIKRMMFRKKPSKN